jgi:hypothetical protein
VAAPNPHDSMDQKHNEDHQPPVTGDARHPAPVEMTTRSSLADPGLTQVPGSPQTQRRRALNLALPQRSPPARPQNAPPLTTAQYVTPSLRPDPYADD